MAPSPAACDDMNPVVAGGKPAGRGNPRLESVETVHHRLPLRQLAIDGDEERQRALDAGESRSGLHHAAELDFLREVGRRYQDVGKDHRGLRIAGGERRQLLGAGHDGEPVLDHASEANQQAFALGFIAAQQRDLLGVFPHPHQVEAKIRLVLLLPEIDPDQRPADQMGQDGAEHRIDQRAPDEIARDREIHARTGAAARRWKVPTG